MTTARSVADWDQSLGSAGFAGPLLTGLLACQHADEQFSVSEGLRRAGVRIAAHARHLGVRYLTANSAIGQRLVAATLLSPAAAGIRAPMWGRILEPALLVDGHVGGLTGMEVAADRLRTVGAPIVHGLAWLVHADPGMELGPASALASIAFLNDDALA